ncbi:MAG: group II truncated hemoglobin [Polyangiales bacterium]
MKRDRVAPPVSSSANPACNPHFAAIGGRDGITRLVECFYAQMDALPEAAELRALHPQDLAELKRGLVQYLAEWMGGPAEYSETPGEPRLRRKHRGFTVGEAQRDVWMVCMRAALTEVVRDAVLRAQLYAAFWQVAEYLRNDPAHQHDKHCADPDHG